MSEYRGKKGRRMITCYIKKIDFIAIPVAALQGPFMCFHDQAKDCELRKRMVRLTVGFARDGGTFFFRAGALLHGRALKHIAGCQPAVTPFLQDPVQGRQRRMGMAQEATGLRASGEVSESVTFELQSNAAHSCNTRGWKFALWYSLCEVSWR